MSYSKKPKTINPDEVDPSVYYYDEVYDDMKDEEKLVNDEQKSSNKERDRKSKYIDGLKKTAEQRKTDQEIRKFKKYTRDREEAATNEDLSSEDVYITSAYRKKLKEIEKLEKEKKRQIEREKDNSMNFTRQESSGKKVKSSRKDESSPSTSTLAPAPSSSKITGTQVEFTDKDNRKDFEGQKSPVKSATTRKKLITLEDRRAYLREVLAKRTVGKIYDEAVSRYIERKAQSQK